MNVKYHVRAHEKTATRYARKIERQFHSITKLASQKIHSQNTRRMICVHKLLTVGDKLCQTMELPGKTIYA